MRRIFISLSICFTVIQISHSQVLTPTYDVGIPTRDTMELASDIYVPDTTQQYSTILIMTPYYHEAYRWLGLPLFGFDVANMNYAMVIVDWRCFYESQPACVAQPNNGEDGYDMIDWIVQQPWSNGKVGTWGPSALGKVQFLTMKEHHAAHICAVPMVAGPQFNYDEYFPGGAAITERIQQMDSLGFGLTNLLYSNAVYNPLWQFSEPLNFYPEEIDIPILYIGGWYDHNVEVMTEFWDGLMQQSSAASEHTLLMGPWVHGGSGQAYVGSEIQGELSYPNAAGDGDSMAIAFFDFYLRNISNDWDNTLQIVYYQLGDDEWMNSPEWPPTGMTTDTLFLDEAGFLLTEYPDVVNAESSFDYDPADPSPTIGGPTLRQDLDQGPFDQSPIVESRNDILIFTSPELTEDVIVKGKIKANLFVSSDKPDTDFSVRLTDVYPDGRSMLLLDGIQRMRFRNGYTENDTSMMIPGSVYPISIILNDVAITFKAGHKIRLDVTSANYPRFDNNLNNGGQMYVPGDSLIATNTVYASTSYPSHIVIPVEENINLAVDEINSVENIFQIYPNPVGELCVVSCELCEEESLIEVFDVAGNEIYSMPFTANCVLHTANWPAGVYLMQISSEEGMQALKFVKK